MNHEAFAAKIDNIAMLAGIMAGLSAAAAALSTPTGLAAVGVWLGLVDEPFIITAAPFIDTFATAAGAISGMTFFYAKWKKRQIEKRRRDESPDLPDRQLE